MAFAVPITVIAFLMGHVTMPVAISMTSIDPYDVTALLVVTGGCFLYNWTDEDEEEATSIKEKEKESLPYYYHYHKKP
jgi:hypothetical protein